MADEQPTPEAVQPEVPPIDLANRKTVVVDIRSNQPYSITLDKYAELVATGNFREPTEQEFRDVQYAEEQATTASRYSTLVAQALPGVGWVANRTAQLMGETEEETAQRIRDAEMNTTGVLPLVAKGMDLASSMAIDALVTAGLAATAPISGPALVLSGLAVGGAISGLGSSLNAKDQYPGMTGAQVAANTLFSVAANVATGGLFYGGEQYVAKKAAAYAAKQASGQTVETVQQIAARQFQILEAIQVNPKKIENLRQRGLTDEAIKSLERFGMFSKDERVSLAALDNMEASYKSTFNNVEAKIGNNIMILDQKKNNLLATALRIMDEAPGNEKKSFSNAASAILDDIPEIIYAKDARAKMQALERSITQGTWSGNETSAVQEFKREASKFYREAWEAEAKSTLPADEFSALKQANLDFVIHEAAAENIAERLIGSRPKFNAAGVANVGIAGAGAMSGNLASLLFNSIQYTAHQASKLVNSPRTMLAALKKAQGMVVQQQVSASRKALETIVHHTLLGATKAVASYATYQTVLAGLKENELIMESAEQAGQSILTGVADLVKYSGEMADAAAMIFDSPQQQQEYAQSTAKIAEVAMRELPKPVVAQILDNPNETPELSDIDKEHTREVASALLNPVGTMLLDPTKRQVELIKEVHPQFAQEMVEFVLEKIVEARESGVNFSTEQKEKIQLWLGGGSTYEDPEFVLRMQASAKELATRSNTPAPPRSPSSSKFGSSMASGSETPAQRVGRL